ncbi:MAG: DUF1206 domain-containing protein [Oscillochloris sp.]|nr:DUF1206 domain-containing protein [Oscillochloris sp.]
MKARRAAEDVSPWLKTLTRLGYAAKGIVYALVGILAIQIIIGTSGQDADTRSALREIAQQPFGTFLLWVVGIGLLFYALWRFVQGGLDPDNKGNDAKGIITRIGYAVSGVIYTGLAFSAFGIVTGTGSGGGGGGGDQSAQGWTAWLMSQPFGQWLVGIVGAIVVGVGIYQIYKGATKKFREKLKTYEMGNTERTWSIRSGQIGLIAHGVVQGLIGWFLIQAAWQAQPQEARGLGGALATLLQQPYGQWLMGAVAIGLFAYGVFQFVLARYRQIPAMNTSS